MKKLIALAWALPLVLTGCASYVADDHGPDYYGPGYPGHYYPYNYDYGSGSSASATTAVATNNHQG